MGKSQAGGRRWVGLLQGRRVQARLLRLERLPNTRSGNPRYWVFLSGRDAVETEYDSQVAFGVTEFVGLPVVAWLNEFNRLVGIEASDG